MTVRTVRTWGSGLLVILFPAVAQAHMMSSGFGMYYDGLVHFLYSPDDVVGALALALLAGLNGKAHCAAVIFILPLAWLAGGMSGMLWTGPVSWEVANALSYLPLGVLVAADVKLPVSGVAALGAAYGLLHGFVNGSTLIDVPDAFVALAGITTAVFFVLPVPALRVVTLRAYWTRIVVRVMGSWIAALGLLMIGWAFRQAHVR